MILAWDRAFQYWNGIVVSIIRLMTSVSGFDWWALSVFVGGETSELSFVAAYLDGDGFQDGAQDGDLVGVPGEWCRWWWRGGGVGR